MFFYTFVLIFDVAVIACQVDGSRRVTDKGDGERRRERRERELEKKPHKHI